MRTLRCGSREVIRRPSPAWLRCMHSLSQSIIGWDRAAFLSLNHGMKCAPLDRIMPWLTDLGLSHVQIILVVALAVITGWRAVDRERNPWIHGVQAIRMNRAWVGPAILAIVTGGLTADVVKEFVHGQRPWSFYNTEHLAGRSLDVEVYTVTGTDPMTRNRFPSGHTATSFGIAVALIPVFRGRKGGAGILAGVWALATAIGLSRIYLGSHWPLDLLCGGAIGALFGWFSYELCRRYAHRRHAATDVETQADDRHETLAIS